MEEEAVIEKNIKQFVFSKINEDVALDKSKCNLISIKHRSKGGSIALARFWLSVFQHQNNYPMSKYSYEERYDKPNKVHITNENKIKNLEIFEPRHEKIGFLHMRKQKGKSASL